MNGVDIREFDAYGVLVPDGEDVSLGEGASIPGVALGGGVGVGRRSVSSPRTSSSPNWEKTKTSS
jgi:hypothetical protein